MFRFLTLGRRACAARWQPRPTPGRGHAPAPRSDPLGVAGAQAEPLLWGLRPQLKRRTRAGGAGANPWSRKSPQRAPPAGRSPGQSSWLFPSRAWGAGHTSRGPVWLRNRLLPAGRRVAAPGPAKGPAAAAQGSVQSAASGLAGITRYASVAQSGDIHRRSINLRQGGYNTLSALKDGWARGWADG